MKTIIYAGHLSRFGSVFLKTILRNEFFKVETIVLADQDRWVYFFDKLKKGQRPELKHTLLKRHKKETRALLGYLSAGYPEIKVSLINDANAEDGAKLVSGHDLVLSAAYPQIFSKSLIETPAAGAINFHPSYLPRCRGAHPVYWTIASREPFGGLSSHFMTKQLDAGPIVARKKVTFNPERIVYKELYDHILSKMSELIDETALFFIEKRKAIPQDDQQASFFSEDLDIHHRIYWNQENTACISAKVRAGNAFSYVLSGRKVYLTAPVTIAAASGFVTNHYHHVIRAGTLVDVTPSSVVVKGRDGYIEVAYRLQQHWLSSRFDRLAKMAKVQLPKFFYAALRAGEQLI